MSTEETIDALETLLSDSELLEASRLLSTLSPNEIGLLIERMSKKDGAVAFRLLSKSVALNVFEQVSPYIQSELLESLGEEYVVEVFTALDPDDRVELMDELPAKVAKRLIQNLSREHRELTAVILGYPKGSVGRRMSPEYVSVRATDTVKEALRRVRERGEQSETIYTIPVVDQERGLVGVVGLDDLFLGEPEALVADYMENAASAAADEDSEAVARRFMDLRLLAMPIVDHEKRLVGLLTIDDAVRIVDSAQAEDAARAGASEPLQRPYLHTPVVTITRSRVVWLLVLGIGALLTVNVIDFFEATLQQKFALSLFIPLLTGIGGNTGSQAATTLTRAIAMQEASIRDVGKVIWKEVRTGFLLGIILGTIGWGAATLIYDPDIGLVIGFTLVSICTFSAMVGGAMPLIAKAVGVDPAVFSTPFISTVSDATGLLIYFSIAKTVLGI